MTFTRCGILFWKGNVPLDSKERFSNDSRLSAQSHITSQFEQAQFNICSIPTGNSTSDIISGPLSLDFKAAQPPDLWFLLTNHRLTTQAQLLQASLTLSIRYSSCNMVYTGLVTWYHRTYFSGAVLDRRTTSPTELRHTNESWTAAAGSGQYTRQWRPAGGGASSARHGTNKRSPFDDVTSDVTSYRAELWAGPCSAAVRLHLLWES